VHDQELALDRIALARAIDVHASLVQDRLTERELLARVASGLFRASSVVKPNVLEPLRSAIYAFKTDFVVAAWIARLKPSELDAPHGALGSAGFPNPTIRAYDDKPLDPAALTQPLNVLMDLEPRSNETKALAGRSYDQDPVRSAMLTRAREEKRSVASDPVPLLRPDGPVGVILAAPVVLAGAPEPAGFVTFSYELAPLMLPNDDLSLFSVALKDPRKSGGELIANDRGVVSARETSSEGPTPSATRTVS